MDMAFFFQTPSTVECTWNGCLEEEKCNMACLILKIINKVTPRTLSQSRGQKNWSFLCFLFTLFQKTYPTSLTKTKLIHTRAVVVINVKKNERMAWHRVYTVGYLSKVSVQILQKKKKKLYVWKSVCTLKFPNESNQGVVS